MVLIINLSGEYCSYSIVINFTQCIVYFRKIQTSNLTKITPIGCYFRVIICARYCSGVLCPVEVCIRKCFRWMLMMLLSSSWSVNVNVKCVLLPD